MVGKGEAKSDQYEWRHLREEPLRSPVMFNTVPGSRAGWTGWHTNEFPQESSHGLNQPASHVSKCGRRRRERRPLAVVPSVNIKTPSSSPTPSLCASLAQIYMIIKEARRERTRRRAILLTYSLPYSLIHPLADPERASNNFNANINRRWMDYRGWNPLKRKFLVSRDRPVSYVYHRSLVVSSINF